MFTTVLTIAAVLWVALFLLLGHAGLKRNHRLALITLGLLAVVSISAGTYTAVVGERNQVTLAIASFALGSGAYMIWLLRRISRRS